jgi:predicted transport protein
MSDIKLFQINHNSVNVIDGKSMAVEKSLQNLLEKHLEEFLGVRFIHTEYSTGKTHKGRIDTLGIDENSCPVIIEYKRALNENVINQGLYYLDWLLDHKAEFTLLVQKRCSTQEADQIDWSGARLLCIAGDYTKFDEHAVKQINRNIELIRYRRYGEGLLLLELVNASSGDTGDTPAEGKKQKITYTTVDDLLSKCGQDVKDRFESLKAYLLALGDDVQIKETKFYFAFKRIKNFASIEVHPVANKIIVFVYTDFDTVHLEDGFTRDVRNVGHLGTGDLEITISSDDDLERAKPLIVKSYEEN